MNAIQARVLVQIEQLQSHGALGEVDVGLEAHSAAVAAAAIGLLHCAWGTNTIHDTPKRSATMPNAGEKKVLTSGCCT